MTTKVKIKLSTLLFLILSGLVSCINPIYPEQMFLQHIGTLLLIVILAIDIKRDKLFISSYLGIAIFTLIHIIGARYIYSYVPYNEWLQSLLGVSIDGERNHYDRFVHLVFGILIFPYLMQVFSKWNLSIIKTILIAWLSVQALSMFYELFEWSLTILLSSEAAQNYNGQQGDMWDAHKDMVLAMIGSIVMCIVYITRDYKKSG